MYYSEFSRSISCGRRKALTIWIFHIRKLSGLFRFTMQSSHANLKSITRTIFCCDATLAQGYMALYLLGIPLQRETSISTE
ncbi:hypothetical protein BDZ91DRAFT_711871 [Kalaharituber pfeilii]|nr:hypothetical protein BDZ91DRAFT_711871 [Kalaharituber pfeilii]